MSKLCLSMVRSYYMFNILTILFLSAFEFQPITCSASEQEVKSQSRMTSFTEINGDRSQHWEESGYYIRGQSKEKVLQRLQTSIIRLTNREKYPDLEVDLVGAIHFGDIEYYQTLSRHFENYDVVLYEMVYMNKSQEPDRKFHFQGEYLPGSRSLLNQSTVNLFPDYFSALRSTTNHGNYIVYYGELKKNSKDAQNLPLYWFGKAQNWIGQNLKLASQTEYIDYSRKNMYHADIDAETLTRRFVENGDLNDLVLRVVIECFLAPSKASEISGIGILFARNKRLALKRTVAESLLTAFIDDINESSENVIIAERNKIALKSFDAVLRQIKNGKPISSSGKSGCNNGSKGKEKNRSPKKSPQRIAIFYGCAHLPDFIARLKKEYGFVPEKVCWVTAWELSENN